MQLTLTQTAPMTQSDFIGALFKATARNGGVSPDLAIVSLAMVDGWRREMSRYWDYSGETPTMMCGVPLLVRDVSEPLFAYRARP